MRDFSAEDSMLGPDMPAPSDRHALGPGVTPELEIIRHGSLDPEPLDAPEQPIVAGEGRRNHGDRNLGPEIPTASVAIGAASLGAATEVSDAPGNVADAPVEPLPITAVEVTERPQAPTAELDKELEVVPQYEIIGETREHPQMLSAVSKYINMVRDRASFQGERPPTTDEADRIVRLSDALLEVAREVGIDPSGRLLGLKNYHFFDRKEDMARAEDREVDDVSRGIYHPAKGILLCTEPMDDGEDKDFRLAHEIGHSLTHQNVRPMLAPDGDPRPFIMMISSSYKREQGAPLPAWGIDEMVTEIFADRAMSITGRTVDHYAPLQQGYYHPYIPFNCIGDAVLEEAATVHTTSPKEIEDMILKGYLNGEQAGMELIGQTLGKERMRRFQELIGDEGIERVLEEAHALQLPRAVTLIERYKAGQPVELFRWRPSTFR